MSESKSGPMSEPRAPEEVWIEVDRDGCLGVRRSRFRDQGERYIREDKAFPSAPSPSLFEEIAAWQRVTFPHKTPESCAAHLMEEARELKAEPRDAEEAADVLHLLIGIADSCGYDLMAALRAKFEKNKGRDWSAPPNAEWYVKARQAEPQTPVYSGWDFGKEPSTSVEWPIPAEPQTGEAKAWIEVRKAFLFGATARLDDHPDREFAEGLAETWSTALGLPVCPSEETQR